MAGRKKKEDKVEAVVTETVVETETTEDAPEVSVTETDETTVANDEVGTTDEDDISGDTTEEETDTTEEEDKVETVVVATTNEVEVPTDKKIVPVQTEDVPDKMFNLKRMKVSGIKYAQMAQNFVDKEVNKEDIAEAIANKDYAEIDRAYFG